MPSDLLLNVSHGDYHGDNFEGSPRLSRSIAVRLLHQSPLHAWTAHPKLGGMPIEEPEEDAQVQARLDTGSLIHQLLLGSGPELVEIYIHGDKKKGQDPAQLYPAATYATKEAQELRDAARAVGALPVIPAKLEAAKQAASALRRRLEQYGVPLAAYSPEVTALWESGGVASKVRMDGLLLSQGSILDLKVVDRINLGAFERSVQAFGLDIQSAVYPEAVEAAHPPLAGRASVTFSLLERLPPHDVALVSLSPALVDLGAQRWARARGIWRRCLDSGIWPGFGVQAPIEAKPWDLEKEFAASLSAAGEPAWSKE